MMGDGSAASRSLMPGQGSGTPIPHGRPPAFDPAATMAMRMALMARARPCPPAAAINGPNPADMMRMLAQAGAPAAYLRSNAVLSPPGFMGIPPRAAYPYTMEHLMAARQQTLAARGIPLGCYPTQPIYASHPFLRDPNACLAYHHQKAAIVAAHAAAAGAAAAAPAPSSALPQKMTALLSRPGPPPALHLKLAPANFQQKELERFQPDTRQPVVVERHQQSAKSPCSHEGGEESVIMADKKRDGTFPVSAAAAAASDPTVREGCATKPSHGGEDLVVSTNSPVLKATTPTHSLQGMPQPLTAGIPMTNPRSRVPPPPLKTCATDDHYPGKTADATYLTSPSPRASAAGDEEDLERGPNCDLLARNKRRERWTAEEHERFLEGLNKYGRRWTKIQLLLPHKTASQIRVHAYSFFSKLMQDSGAGFNFPMSPITPGQQQQQQHMQSFASSYPEQQPQQEALPSTHQLRVLRTSSEEGADLLEVAQIISTLRKTPRGEHSSSNTSSHSSPRASDAEEGRQQQLLKQEDKCAGREGEAMEGQCTAKEEQEQSQGGESNQESPSQSGLKRRLEDEERREERAQKRAPLPSMALIRQEKQ